MHKIAFHLGNFTIYWYGVLVALGLLAGLWTAGRRAPLSGIRTETVIDLGPWLILGTIVGARGLYVLSYWRQDFAKEPFWRTVGKLGIDATIKTRHDPKDFIRSYPKHWGKVNIEDFL